MNKTSADYVVIGSGPAGQKAAIQAAKLGKSVIVIEKKGSLGGGCLNSGTIPSKSLREAIVDLTGFYQKNFYADKYLTNNFSVKDLNFRLNKVLDDHRTIILQQFTKNHIQLLEGEARFINPHCLAVTNENQEALTVEGQFFLIATGSRPRNPLHIPFDQEVVLDSTRLLQIDRLPKTLLVLGSGIIGSEYASFFAALGTKVTVVDKKPQMIPLLDQEMGLHLQQALGKLGLTMLGQKELTSVQRIDDHAEILCKDGTTLHADMLLYALGREANVKELRIESIGLNLNASGYISVNTLFQTPISHIYAAGDVIGGPCLASTSMEQGRLAARHACGVQSHYFPTFYPVGIYTIPEISFCGYTEEQLTKLGFRYEVGRAHYYEIARNLIVGNEPGLFKILFHCDTLEILGVHIIGRTATELIHIGQIAMSFNARIDYFIDQVFNYPTYAEGYRIAALNGVNKLKHKK